MVRKEYPNLTLSACRTIMSVVVEADESGLSYHDVAELAGIDYIQAAHQIEMLSSGRNENGGLGLLIRQQGISVKQRAVLLSPKGERFARTFAPVLKAEVSKGEIARQIGCGPLPAFKIATELLPGMALGTFTVLLSIALKQRAFGIGGSSAKTIADELEVSNLPRHLAILGDGLGDRSGFGLINMIENAKDRRIKLPELSAKGHRLVTEIASNVVGHAIETPRKVKPEVLYALESPDDMSAVSDEDYIPIKTDDDAL